MSQHYRLKATEISRLAEHESDPVMQMRLVSAARIFQLLAEEEDRVEASLAAA